MLATFGLAAITDFAIDFSTGFMVITTSLLVIEGRLILGLAAIADFVTKFGAGFMMFTTLLLVIEGRLILAWG